MFRSTIFLAAVDVAGAVLFQLRPQPSYCVAVLAQDVVEGKGFVLPASGLSVYFKLFRLVISGVVMLWPRAE